MNKSLQILGGAVLAFAVMVAPAQADWGRGYRGPGHGPSHHNNHNHHNHNNHHNHHRHHSGAPGWVAPLVLLGIAGAALSAAATPSPPPVTYVQPPPVVVQPPVTYMQPAPVVQAPAPAPAGTWYYCASASMYYPHTQHCPEGWQAVRPSTY